MIDIIIVKISYFISSYIMLDHYQVDSWGINLGIVFAPERTYD